MKLAISIFASSLLLAASACSGSRDASHAAADVAHAKVTSIAISSPASDVKGDDLACDGRD